MCLKMKRDFSVAGIWFMTPSNQIFLQLGQTIPCLVTYSSLYSSLFHSDSVQSDQQRAASFQNTPTGENEADSWNIRQGKVWVTGESGWCR